MSAPSHALTSRLDAQALATAPAFMLPATAFAQRALVVTLDVTRELLVSCAAPLRAPLAWILFPSARHCCPLHVVT